MKQKQVTRDDPTVPMGNLIARIVESACELRDVDWEMGQPDPGPILDRMDAAVDAYRARLLVMGRPS